MAKTVVGLFDDLNDADAVVRELIDAGAKPEHISVVRTGSDVFADRFRSPGQGTTASGAAVGGTTTTIGGLLTNSRSTTVPGIGPVSASGPLADRLTRGGGQHVLIDELTERGVTDADSRFYAEGVRRGSTLVLLRVLDEDADEVADIMEHHGAIDIHERTQNWRSRGWSGFDLGAKPFTRDEFTRERELCRTGLAATGGTVRTPERTTSREGDTVLPVIEEELHVGKRQVQRRGVRLVQEVKERPVEETLRLREERVRVERHPVNRPVVSGDRLDTLKDRTIELTETAEEAVVDKTARVKEEVVVHKDTTFHDEKIRDTVKSTDVRVEETGKTKKFK